MVPGPLCTGSSNRSVHNRRNATLLLDTDVPLSYYRPQSSYTHYTEKYSQRWNDGVNISSGKPTSSKYTNRNEVSRKVERNQNRKHKKTKNLLKMAEEQ